MLWMTRYSKLIVDFIITITLAAIISAAASMFILFQVSKTENNALQIAKSNSTVEIFRWAIETELEEISYFQALEVPVRMENLTSSIDTTLVALKFIEYENLNEEGEWKDFYLQSKELSEELRSSNSNINEIIKQLKIVHDFLEAYKERSFIFVDTEFSNSKEKRELVTFVVIIIFILHIFLFLLSIRLDLKALSMEKNEE